MNRTKSLFVCVLAVLTSSISSQAKDQGEGTVTPKQVAPPESAAALDSKNDEPCQCVDQKESPAGEKIEQALAGPLHSSGLQFADTPLSDVLSQLQDEYGIPIQLDAAALENAGVGTDSPVTKALHNISLRSALKLMLEPLQLTSTIRDEVLMVTTNEAADRHLLTCVYRVKGLVDETDPKAIDGLITAIKSCVAPESWSGNAGKHADVRPLKPGLLVISQTPAIQEEVNGLLAKVRKAREQVPATNAAPHAAAPVPIRPTVNPTKKTDRRDSDEGDSRNIDRANPFGG